MPGHDEVKLEKVCTKEELIALRDTQQNSWAKVATALGLGSPGAARRIYSAVVRPHTESVLAGTPRNGTKVTPVHLADASLDQVQEALVGRTLVVQRANGTEEILVTKVTSLKAGTINFHDGDKARSVKVAAVIATK